MVPFRFVCARKRRHELLSCTYSQKLNDAWRSFGEGDAGLGRGLMA